MPAWSQTKGGPLAEAEINDLVAFLHDDVRARGNRVARDRFVVVVHNDDLRVQILLVFDDDHGFLLGLLVHFLLHGDALDLMALLKEQRGCERAVHAAAHGDHDLPLRQGGNGRRRLSRRRRPRPTGRPTSAPRTS